MIFSAERDEGLTEKHNLLVQWGAVVFGSLYGLTFNQWISLGVLLTGAVTMMVNWYYKQKHLELERLRIQQRINPQIPNKNEDFNNVN